MTDQISNTELQPHLQSHSNLMDKVYRNQRFIYNASRKYYLLGRDQLIKELSPPPRGTVLELGAGTGRNLICTAKTYDDCELYGVDISQEMLKTAGKSIVKAGFENRIHLAKGDATNFNAEKAFGVKEFDRVFISFSLSMIPEWQMAIASSYELTRPGGQIHIVDFGECKQYPKMFQKLLYAWLSIFHVHPIRNLPGQLKEAANKANCKVTVKPLYGGYSLQAIIQKPR
ncbi:MAG: O-methyltransferase [Methyloligella sp.]|nr:MAG: O-methyltransferase [Methyloligella sp.]